MRPFSWSNIAAFIPALFLAVSCGAVPIAAQTLALPASAPEYLQAGESVIVRPIVRDVLGRPTSVVRVQAWSSDTTVLRVSYVSGGQRLTAVSAGTAHVTWRWQRTDGQSRTLAHTVRVTASAPPPVDSVPVVVPPTPPAGLVGLVAEPNRNIQLVEGASAVLRVVGATIRSGTSTRPATAAEFAAVPYVYKSSKADVASVSDDGRITGLAPGMALVSVCAGTVCQNRVVTVSARPDTLPPVPVTPAITPTRWVGLEPSTNECIRPLVAGEHLGVRGDTALFVRALEGLPAWAYCVADSLAVTLEGDLVVSGESSTEPPTLFAFARGAELPTVWPATGQGDTTVTVDSVRITGAGSEGGGMGTTTVLGLLGAGAVVSLLAGANALARRGKAEDA